MKHKLFYNFHDILRVELNTDRLGRFRAIDLPFSYFLTKDTVGHPDIVINIGPFDPDQSATVSVDHNRCVKDDYLFDSQGNRNAKWKFEISGFESRATTIINFESRVGKTRDIFFHNYLGQYVVLRPMIELMLPTRGYLTLHGLGFEKGGNSYVMAARGGAHKTRIAMELLNLEQQYRIVGDDRIIVGRDRRTYSFPMFYELVFYRAQRRGDQHYDGLRDLLGSYRFSRNFRSERDEIDKYIARESRLKTVFMAARKQGLTEARTESIEKKEMIKGLVASNKMEMIEHGGLMSLNWIDFLRDMQTYSYVFPTSGIAGYWDTFSSLLDTLLPDRCIKVSLPISYSSDLFMDLIEAAENA